MASGSLFSHDVALGNGIARLFSLLRVKHILSRRMLSHACAPVIDSISLAGNLTLFSGVALQVQGDQHLEHRLHLLLLEQEKKRCRNKPEHGGSAAISLPPPSPRVAPGENPLEQYRSPKHCYPDVTLKPMSRLGYWVVRVGCKDRDKLLFDVVCTFADMDYDVYHGTVDCDGKVAFLEFYIRPRFHEVEWDDDRMETLKYLLEAAIRRRFPKGLKLHVHSLPKSGYLIFFLRALNQAGLCITR